MTVVFHSRQWTRCGALSCIGVHHIDWVDTIVTDASAAGKVGRQELGSVHATPPTAVALLAEDGVHVSTDRWPLTYRLQVQRETDPMYFLAMARLSTQACIAAGAGTVEHRRDELWRKTRSTRSPRRPAPIRARHRVGILSEPTNILPTSA